MIIVKGLPLHNGIQLATYMTRKIKVINSLSRYKLAERWKPILHLSKQLSSVYNMFDHCNAVLYVVKQVSSSQLYALSINIRESCEIVCCTLFFTMELVYICNRISKINELNVSNNNIATFNTIYSFIVGGYSEFCSRKAGIAIQLTVY